MAGESHKSTKAKEAPRRRGAGLRPRAGLDQVPVFSEYAHARRRSRPASLVYADALAAEVVVKTATARLLRGQLWVRSRKSHPERIQPEIIRKITCYLYGLAAIDATSP